MEETFLDTEAEEVLTFIGFLDYFYYGFGVEAPVGIVSQPGLGLPDDVSSAVEIVDVTGDRIEWKLDVSDLPDSRSLVSGVSEVKLEVSYKHRHEYVCDGLMLGVSDKRFMDVFPFIGDDEDHLTPDFIVSTHSAIHVIEVTTRLSSSDKIARRALEEKMFKYETAIRNRHRDNHITLTIIVVTLEGTFSNVSLPQWVVDELTLRMRIADALERKANKMNISMPLDEREQWKTRISTQIHASIETMTGKEPTHGIRISSGFIKDALEEPDKHEFEKILIKEILDTKANVLSWPDQSRSLSDFLEEMRGPGKKFDKKSIVSIPFLNPDLEETPSSDIPKMSTDVSDEIRAVSKLWDAALQDYQNNPDIQNEDPSELLEHVYDEDVARVQKVESLRRDNRKKYHRVKLRDVLSEDEEIELASSGVWAKKFRDRQEMHIIRKESQKPYHWDTDLTDIQDFLKDSSDLDIIEPTPLPMSLIQEGLRLSGSSDSALTLLEGWRSTRLWRAMDVISDIAIELAIANKQHCSPRTMIMKKLRNYPVYLLVSPTKSTEHTFFSILIRSGHSTFNHQGVFGKLFKIPGGYITEFKSLKVGKYENLASAPSCLLSLVSFWSWFYDIRPDITSFKENSQALEMLKLSLLIRLEDKAQTEEAVTLTRYMYMEIFKSHLSLLPPLPFTIFTKKCSRVPRSRLCLYIMRKSVEGFSAMLENPPVRVMQSKEMNLEEGEDATPNDSWRNLLNIYTSGNIITASKAVNLFYLGYLKNKNQSPEGNTDFSLIEKTCEEELSIPEDTSGCFGNPKEKPGPKEFDLNSIKIGCMFLERRLRNIYGTSWKATVYQTILDALSDRMTTEIATLKASCSVDHSNTDGVSNLDDPVGAGRLRVLQAIKRQIDKFGLNPFTNLKYFITHIESTTDGVVADLFKKQQHGGLREIYVLSIESRVIQLYLETISRCLCSYFEEETLTHPKNKLRKLTEHKHISSRLAQRDSRLYVDYCSSTDKTRWNQNFVITAMSIPLFRLTPSSMHNSIQRSINLWAGKLIKIPQRVQVLLLNKVQLSSPVFHKLLEEFWKANPTLINRPHGQFIKLQSGMMQGILHYTSSLLHLCFLQSITSTLPPLLRRLHPGYDFRLTQVCSSDDSATILSILGPKGQTTLTKGILSTFMKCSVYLHSIDSLAAYYCMKTSEKSNTANLDYVEFNSEFYFKNTLAMPVIKYVAASLNLTESESFLERQQVCYNLISDLYATGYPAENTHISQISQALNHYKTMGSSTSALFKEFESEIKSYPDPSLGFFLLDNYLCPGALGWSYSYWCAAISSPIFKRSAKDYMADSCEVTESGGIVSSLMVKHGDLKRWKTFAKEIVSDLDLYKEIENQPHLLFRPGRTTKEIKISLAIKATMPSVAKSMRKGNPYMQALATSVYGLTTHCFSKTTVQMKDGIISREYDKTSLLLELKQRKSQVINELNEKDLILAFPALDRYKEARSVLNKMSEGVLVRCHPFRSRKCDLMVQPMLQHVPLSLQQTCCYRWFNFPVRTTHRIAERCWREYGARLNWLKDTISDTLAHSPFSSYQELANFISSQALKMRCFTRVGPNIASARFRGQLYHLVRKSQRDGHVIKMKREVDRASVSSDLMSKISLAMTLPLTEIRNKEIHRLLKTHKCVVDDLENTSLLGRRESRFAHIHWFVKNQDEPHASEKVTTSLNNSGSGVLFSYVKPQQRVETSKGVIWKGDGKVIASFDNLVCILDLHDSKVTSITTNRWSQLKGHSSTMMYILNELKVSPETTGFNCLARFDGRFWQLPSGVGVPVYESLGLKPVVGSPSPLKLNITRDTISLVQPPAGPGQRPLAVVTHRPLPGDVNLSYHSTPCDDFIRCWLDQRPLPADKAAALILKLSKGGTRVLEAYREWAHVTLKSRLSQKGQCAYGLATRGLELLLPSEVTEVEEELSDDAFAELQLGMAEFMDNEDEFYLHMKPDYYEDSVGWADEVEFDESMACIVNNLFDRDPEGSLSVSKERRKTIHFSHPLWDHLIEELMRDQPRFWDSIFKGEVIRAEEDLSRALMNLLGLREKTHKVSMTSRAKALLEEMTFTFEDRRASIEETPSMSTEVTKDSEPDIGAKMVSEEEIEEEEGYW